tara:strand:+ start:3469 stop:3735 length:267 start_codon:yes stop_codon:yes gene_type:complete
LGTNPTKERNTMIELKISQSEFGPVQLERTIDGKACNINFFGGSFYISNPPSNATSGLYKEIIFKPSEFKGAYQPREIISLVPVETKK